MSRRPIAVCAVFLLSSACLAQQKPAPAAAPASAPAATPAVAPQPQGPKKRVAVMSFEYGTVMSSVQAICENTRKYLERMETELGKIEKFLGH